MSTPMVDLPQISCPNPSPINPLQVTGFELRITKIPELSFWVKDANLPSISLSGAMQDSPFRTIPHVGDKPEYGTLNVRIMVDEYMRNYSALYTWITLTTFPEYYGQLDEWRRRWFGQFNAKDTDTLLVSDATLIVKAENGRSAGAYTFRNLWIDSLGGLSLSDEATETQYLYADAEFVYEDFRFEPFPPKMI